MVANEPLSVSYFINMHVDGKHILYIDLSVPGYGWEFDLSCTSLGKNPQATPWMQIAVGQMKDNIHLDCCIESDCWRPKERNRENSRRLDWSDFQSSKIFFSYTSDLNNGRSCTVSEWLSISYVLCKIFMWMFISFFNRSCTLKL